MSIKFIVDSLKEQDRKHLDSIKKIINEKPSKISKETKFLRKFTLAILNQYSNNTKFKEELNLMTKNLSNAPKKINLNLKIPKAPSPLKLSFDLDAPKKVEL
jgi:hypothetical protein